MKKLLLFISLLIAVRSVQGQYVSLDSLAKTIKTVNVEKAIAEDHIRLIDEVEYLNGQVRISQLNFYSCTDENSRLSYALNLYKVLDEIEAWDTAKTKAGIIDKTSYIEYDTLPDGKLKKMYLTLYTQHSFNEDNGKLEFEIENHIASNSGWLQSHYPETSQKIQQQIIVIEKRPQSISVPNQVSRIVFPSLVVKVNKVADKKKFAALYLDCIEQVCRDPLMMEYSAKEYVRYEAKAVPNQNIDKILAMRVAFIKVLKDVYAKKTSS